MLLTDDGNANDEILEQPRNAEAPIVVKVLGKDIEDSFVHPLKALSPISETEDVPKL